MSLTNSKWSPKLSEIVFIYHSNFVIHSDNQMQIRNGPAIYTILMTQMIS
jgi:hypothetical protein